jgi:hypothetical protein
MKQKLLSSFGLGKTHPVRPHNSIRLTEWFQVSNYAKVPKASWPLTTEATRKGAKLRLVSLQNTNAGPAQWQKFIADSLCR